MKQITQCPVCESQLEVTELSCTSCNTRLQGSFPPAPLARLPQEHQQFIETFVQCRGIIRDVERALGISYPTVRARLDAAVNALAFEVRQERARGRPPHNARVAISPDPRRLDLLRQVESGELDPADAADALRHLKR